MGDERYTISELAAEFEVTPRTLRFYEEKNLLCPVRMGQRRLYTAADRTRLRLILRGKRLGFSLQESADIISMYDPAGDNIVQLHALLAKIHEKKKALLVQRQDLNTMINDLRTWEKRSLRSVAHIESQIGDK